MAAAASRVRTVLGDVPAATLGRTLIHEHVISSLTCYWDPSDEPSLADALVSLETLGQIRRHPFAARSNLLLDDIHTATKEISGYVQAGGTSVVDATSNGLGRDPRAIQYVAQMSGAHIVIGCGYYIKDSLPTAIAERSRASLAEEMVSEIIDGIGATGIRAGVIGEIGVGTYPADPLECRILVAAAQAQRVTGAGLIVHPASGTNSPFEIARILEKAGATMNKVVISHLDERFRDSSRLFKRLARHGCRFGFDTFGREVYYPRRGRQHPSDEDRIRSVIDMIDAGLVDQVLLSQDICLRHELTTYGGHGYAHILLGVLPRLVRAGVPGELIDVMLVRNPSEVLALDRVG